ncbi:MAG: hypothetical protein E5Y88_00005 [Mesorhizobium sp.]|uniref:hypothetical protein n=1 Tax=Mesorhizobium sp. TaxID=1871066 RepID=UPI0012221FE4|nr:hypothetical protein [Mesorhizobium sp.]TIL27465.1 MAG: hypothetical protein E5Y88_00005 [Mesorhizobium sp.]
MRGFASSSELNAEDQRLREEISGRDSSPFLGQQKLDARVEQALHGQFILHDERAAEALTNLLSAYPAVAITFLASLARTKTGEEGHNAFYKHLARALGVDDLSYESRRELWRAFRTACVKLGLPIPTLGELKAAAKDRYRLEYFVQAGPLNCDLKTLADAFIAVTEQTGDPDTRDPTSCRDALDAVLLELGERAKTLQRVLANDRAAWHAVAFARLRTGAAPSSDFERAFQAAIKDAMQTSGVGARRRRPVFPRLVFSEGGLALRTPSVSGWTWTIAGPWDSNVILGADQELPLGSAEAIHWRAAPLEIGTRTTASEMAELPIWRGANVLVFDVITGGLLTRTSEGDCELASDACYLVSRTPFSLSGQRGEVSSDETLEGMHVAALSLRDGKTTVASDAGNSTITLLQRPSLEWADESLCMLQGSPTFGARFVSLRLHLPEEELRGWAGRVEAVVAAGRVGDERRSAPFMQEGDFLFVRVPVGEVKTFERLHAWVTFVGEERPLLHAHSAWLWPGLQKVEDGCFHGPNPVNLNIAASRNAIVGQFGVVVGTGDGRVAELAFGVGDRLIRIRVQTGEVQIELVERGITKALKPGATILDDGVPKQLRIWCTDRNAALDLCGIVEKQPFGAAGRRSVALAGLGSRGGSRRIEIWPGGDRRRAYGLAVVTRPAEPTHVHLQMIGGVPRGTIGLSERGSLRGLATLLGGDGAAVTLSPGNGLEQRTTSTGHSAVSLSPGSLADGVWLIELCEFVTDEDNLYPLRTARGDRFAILAGSLEGQLGRPEIVAEELMLTEEAQRHFFHDLNVALAKSWARESWEDGGLKALEVLWRRYGSFLSQDDAGQRALVTALGAAPPPDANPSWIPLRHPFELDHQLYSRDLDALAPELLNADSADAREFAVWLMDDPSGHTSIADDPVGGRRLREACLRFVDRLAAATAGAVDGDTNLVRTGNATRLVYALPIDHDRRKREEALIGDIAEQFAIMARVPTFFAAFAYAARTGTLPELLADLERYLPEAVRDVGYLLRLGPELLALGLRAADNKMRKAA